MIILCIIDFQYGMKVKKILRIKYREYPKNGLFRKKYRNDPYIVSEYLDDFVYYENTFIENILFNDNHSIPWDFFSYEGLNYMLPRILETIQEEVDVKDVSISLTDFIINMTLNNYIKILILTLKTEELIIIKSILEGILFYNDESAIRYIGEYYLFLDLEFLERIISK